MTWKVYPGLRAGWDVGAQGIDFQLNRSLMTANAADQILFIRKLFAANNSCSDNHGNRSSGNHSERAGLRNPKRNRWSRNTACHGGCSRDCKSAGETEVKR